MPTNLLIIITFGILILGIIVLISIAWTDRKGAPWVPTRMKKVRKMLDFANVQPGELVYDLGCGDGRIIIIAARRFRARAVGIEIAVLRYLWCKMLTILLGLRKKVRVVYGDFFKKDLSEADVVVCYLLQSTNDKLEEKLIQELRPGTRVVSNTFIFLRLPLIRKYDEDGIYMYKQGG